MFPGKQLDLRAALGMLGPSQNVPDVPAGTLWKTYRPRTPIDWASGISNPNNYYPLVYPTFIPLSPVMERHRNDNSSKKYRLSAQISHLLLC